MFVRCPQCFYENGEQYRFCGMCGAPLPRLGAASEESAKVGRAAAARGEAEPAGVPANDRPPIPVTGPSFLGLSPAQDHHERSLDYLLEDEPEPGRKRIYLALVLVVAAVAMLAWRWRHSGYFSRTRPAVVATQNGTTPNSPDASTPDASASPSGVAPATSSNSDTTAGVSPTDAGRGPTQESAQPTSAAPNNEPLKPAQSGPIADSGQTSNSSSEASGNSAAKPEAFSNTTATPVPIEKRVATPPPVAKAAPRVPKETKAPSAPLASEQDPLVAEGEKYLYGNGVPQNCGRAEKSLLAAAQHASPKAESVLGTMYATGHCVGRDLPTAYRWFAKASHQDPSNARITRDLEVLWKQMTARERQLAVNSRE